MVAPASWVGGGAGAAGGGCAGSVGGLLPPTGAPHMSQKLLPGSSRAPQAVQVNVAAVAGVGTAAGPKAAPQLSQKASPGVTGAPQTGQVVFENRSERLCDMTTI